MELRPFLRVDAELTLHLARHELAPAIFEAIDTQREHLREWLPWVDPTQSLADTTAYIRESMAHNSSGTQLTTFILQGAQLVGSVGVAKFNRDQKSCEIGYWLHRDSQGRGIMTRSCSCLISYLFLVKDLNRIEMLVATGNTRSQAVPLRLGFTKEGTLRQALLLRGKYHDLHVFGLLKNEWTKPFPA